MSYRGKKFYAYIRSLEKLSLERETMPLEMRGRRCGGGHRGRSVGSLAHHSYKYQRKRRLRELEKKLELAKVREQERLEREREQAEREQNYEAERERYIAELRSRLAMCVPDRLRHCGADSHEFDDSDGSELMLPRHEMAAEMTALVEMIREGERNFMDGISYRVNPVDTLKMVSASSVFGEPQYYRDGDYAPARVLDGVCRVDESFARFSLAVLDPFRGMTTAEVMEKAIDDALDADFQATLEWAVELRERYLMRLNPQVILVRAATHPGRGAWTKKHPGEFARIAERVMPRGDDVTNQVQYWLAGHGTKRGVPAVLKRAWAKRVGSMNAYAMAKYGNAGIGLVDVVRICHARGPLVDTLMRKGCVPMPEGQNTWERLRASGMGWKDILETIRMPHMALLRNLRGIFSEVDDPEVREKALALLKRGVRGGKQFPFRYLSAWKAAEAERAPWTRQVQEALEECMAIACENLTELPGRSAFLSDNSGSAWGACTSEWGTMKVAEIGNLSGVIGAMRADEGVVFPFGDRLKHVTIRRDEGVLHQADLVSAAGNTCGMGTENGIWLFFRDAIMQRQHWDNIFVYSDMQAGHGGLYGIDPEDYAVIGARIKGWFIDVNMLVRRYREQVNPKVNVFMIQTAGYTNALVPEYGYRTAILTGWTGKELVFADALNRTWDELESR